MPIEIGVDFGKARLGWLMVIVGGSLIAIAFTVSLVSSSAKANTTSPASKSSATTATKPATKPTLEAQLLSDIDTAGFLQTSENDRNGAITQSQATEDSADPIAESEFLKSNGFVAGYSRGFSDPAGGKVDLLAYEFRDNASAKSYQQSDLQREIIKGAEKFDVAEIVDSTAYTSDFNATLDYPNWRTFSISFVHDNRWFLISTGGPIDANGVATASIDLIKLIAKAQADRVSS